ncbi:MAG: hypothetical protein QM765_48790 [Myxococcales bacterium]
MDAAVSSSRRNPNPKPLLAVLMGIALFGGSCTVQQIIGTSAEAKADKDLAALLSDADKDPEQGAKVFAAMETMAAEQTRVFQRFRPYTTVLGLVLATLYSFAFLSGMRAWNFVPGALAPLSKVAVLILPSRVALAAVDLATAKALEPAAMAFGATLAQAQKSTPPDQFEALTRTLAQTASWLSLGTALVVCAIFHFAWRYFQRPDVVAYFDKMAGPPREE